MYIKISLKIFLENITIFKKKLENILKKIKLNILI